MSKKMRTVFVLGLALIASVFAVQGPLAAQGGDAGMFVKDLGDRAIQTLTVSGISEAERENRFRTLLREGFDVKRIGRFVLGRYSRRLSPSMVEEYEALFEDLIVATYAARFGEYSGQSFDIKRVAQQEGQRDAIVMSEITPVDGGPPIRVDWQVRGAEKDPRIIDVRVEGVSMSITQREEFAAVIQKNGGKVDSLLDALRKKSSRLQSKQ